MAKNTKAAPAQAAASGKKINRNRRNSFERKCLPKAYKRLFAGDGHAVMRSQLVAWQEGRKRVHEKAD